MALCTLQSATPAHRTRWVKIKNFDQERVFRFRPLRRWSPSRTFYPFWASHGRKLVKFGNLTHLVAPWAKRPIKWVKNPGGKLSWPLASSSGAKYFLPVKILEIWPIWSHLGRKDRIVNIVGRAKMSKKSWRETFRTIGVFFWTDSESLFSSMESTLFMPDIILDFCRPAPRFIIHIPWCLIL